MCRFQEEGNSSHVNAVATLVTNLTHNDITMSYPAGTNQITLVGTALIPEFPAGATIGLLSVLAASLILAWQVQKDQECPIKTILA